MPGMAKEHTNGKWNRVMKPRIKPVGSDPGDDFRHLVRQDPADRPPNDLAERQSNAEQRNKFLLDFGLIRNRMVFTHVHPSQLGQIDAEQIEREPKNLFRPERKNQKNDK